METPSPEELAGLPPEWIDRATLLIMDYEGPQDEAFEDEIMERMQPIVHPDGARVLCYSEAHPPELPEGDPAAHLLVFDGAGGEPTGISVNAWMTYRHAKKRKELEYDRDRLGLWVGHVRARDVLVVVGLD